MNKTLQQKDIDIVIAWVDGSDPAMQRKRNQYLEQAKRIPTISSKARRFSDNGEIRFCLQSIATHMPWVNRVYIVTDGQTPECVANMPKTIEPIKDRIRIVDHQEIFRGHEELLPTFNSLSIETFLWRINGLAENFIYMNDDMFFCGAVCPEDFFIKRKVVLRGSWSGWDEVAKLSFHSENNRNGARLTEFSGDKFFKAIHVGYPMRKSILKNAYEANQSAFIKNASHRFRARKQFWPVSLHNHLAFSQKFAKRKRDSNDWVHFSVAFCRDADADAIRKKLNVLSRKDKKLGCLNYSEAVVEKVPGALKKLQKVTAPSLLQRLILMTKKAS
ncbi:Stealth CR1 domain-containing protein [Salinicola halimionae]|uniref:Stealth CR1 domain-containing protein n=1 Tax=Salinicola halimionae TaxID=1949081 RepID=UPI00165F7649|nr:Stealth CR1 domain-containing protein [Salinicola halimionae]